MGRRGRCRVAAVCGGGCAAGVRLLESSSVMGSLATSFGVGGVQPGGEAIKCR